MSPRCSSPPAELDPAAWNALLAPAGSAHALHAPRVPGGAARRATAPSPATGWTPRFVTLWRGDGQLAAGCALYLKDHSYGEYVFDWAWANAYEQHGLRYYPKLLVAVPFTPVPGARLLARDARRAQRCWSKRCMPLVRASRSCPRCTCCSPSTRTIAGLREPPG